MRKRIVIIVGTATIALGAAGTAGAQPFLCPIVGDGVTNNPNKGPTQTIAPPAGNSLLPGNNQAGAHANENAYNSYMDGTPIAGNEPGAPGFTPIWTGA
jgi:hypothetical protein